SSYHVMKWCYDESYSSYGPGQLLIEEIARDCEKLGLRTFDFCGPEYAYERKWTSTGTDHHALYIFRDTWSGRALRRWKLMPVRGLRHGNGAEK
ncbi:MAG: GNAT family N-acetyltransferase, partial [Terriglobales bacterium]